MPETTMDKDRNAMPSENNIGVTGELLGTEAETITHPVEYGAYELLRFCVPVPDARHIPATVLFRNTVSHFRLYLNTSSTESAICRASSGGTALPT